MPLLIELHCHTDRHSACSHVDPVALLRAVQSKGLQGVVLTEHHYLWSADEIAALCRAAELPPGFVVLAGQEVETDVGHVLVYGAPESILDPTPLETLRSRHPAAALVWAHPFRGDRQRTSEELGDPRFDAIEIFNANQRARGNYYGLVAWHRQRFTAVAGSDTHAVENAGIFPTQFDHSVSSVAELVGELRHGRCRPFYRETPHSGANVTVTEVVIGPKGEDEARLRLVIRQPTDDKKWRRAERTAAVVQAVHAAGFKSGPLRVPRILEVDADQRLIIEEGQRGRSLFQLLTRVHPQVGRAYVRLAAEWLAALHAQAPRITDLALAEKRERKRFRSYREAFVATHNPLTAEADRLLRAIEQAEERLQRPAGGQLVQNHGDFHPKNIIVGQDRMHDISTLYVSVIDFEGAILAPRAFDVGYFLAQCEYQFRAHPRVAEAGLIEAFLDDYRAAAGPLPAEFVAETRLFRLRGNLSIAAFLIKVGLGESAELRELVLRSLAELPAVAAVG